MAFFGLVLSWELQVLWVLKYFELEVLFFWFSRRGGGEEEEEEEGGGGGEEEEEGGWGGGRTVCSLNFQRVRTRGY